MSNVTLSIGGRSFTVACAEGEEGHVSELGRMIDSKLATMGDMSGQNEARMLLFATLLLADELHEAKIRAPDVPSEQNAGAEDVGAADAATAERLDALAARLENLAASLEG